jgi:cystathionine beta-lyase
MSNDDSPHRPRRPATEIVHAGRNPRAQHGFVNPPVYRGSTVLFPTMEKFLKREAPYVYGRRGTPTTEALETAVARIEGGVYALLASSGFAAIRTALLAFVEAGDHLLVPDSVYQPTRKFCDQVLKRLGVTTTYYDPLIGGRISDLMTDKTRLVFTESPGSQTFEVQDIPAIAEAAHARGAFVLMDNTWASPHYFKPFEKGCDVSIQAATKYIVGHADAMLGTVTCNDRAKPYLVRAKDTLGPCAGTEEVYLGLRGLRTLDVRLERHMRSGIEMGEWLRRRPEVARVIHPALPGDAGHALWKRDFLGASSLFAFVLKPCPQAAVAAFLDGLELFGMGASWGGYESLMIPFDPRPYRTATKWSDPGQALRIHVGLDDTADLKADLEAGFARLRAGVA